MQTDIARIKTLEKELRSSSKAAGGSVEEVSSLCTLMLVIHILIFNFFFACQKFAEKGAEEEGERDERWFLSLKHSYISLVHISSIHHTN